MNMISERRWTWQGNTHRPRQQAGPLRHHKDEFETSSNEQRQPRKVMTVILSLRKGMTDVLVGAIHMLENEKEVHREKADTKKESE